MIVRAPGKIVLSGAYSVLEGHPAIVSAVDRYALADAQRSTQWSTPEVIAARLRTKPWFDASALRDTERKLGLGSSAAILVASLAADVLEAGECSDESRLADAIITRALAAHSSVQPLGSGVDVVASCYGGTRAIKRVSGNLQHETLQLPAELNIEVWSAPHSQSTHHMLETLLAFRGDQPRLYTRRIADQGAASEQALSALRSNDAGLFIAALNAQRCALELLGNDAGMPIVTDDLIQLAQEAASESAAVLPAGAGGGDVAIFAGIRASSSKMRLLMTHYQHVRLDLTMSAQGVHSLEEGC